MTTSLTMPLPTDVTADDYVVLGFATCFLREEGETTEVTVAEPIPSAYLEAVFKGVPTSYRLLCSTTVGALLQAEQVVLPDVQLGNVNLCENFVERVLAAARSYQSRPTAMTLVPQGQTYTDMNFSIEKKRILNAEHMVSTEDNVKQHEYTHKVL